MPIFLIKFGYKTIIMDNDVIVIYKVNTCLQSGYAPKK